MENKQGFYYLATPYDKFVLGKDRAWYNVNTAAAMLLNEGLVVFSPITHCHPLKVQCALPDDWPFWQNIDKQFTDASVGLIVLKLKGWDESVGVKWEIEEFTKAGKPVIYMKPYYVPTELRGGKYNPDAKDDN